MAIFPIFWLVGLAVVLLFLLGAFQALRICIFGSSELPQSRVTKIRLFSAIAVVLLAFGLFYEPVMEYWTLSQVLNIHGRIGKVQYSGTDFDGFLLVVDEKGRFMPKTQLTLEFRPFMSGAPAGTIKGATNINGLLVLEEKVPDLLEGKYDVMISASNHGRKRTYNTQVEVRSSPLRMYPYSDRKIYKPGHTIHFAGYAWQKAEDSFLPYSGKDVNISLKNEKGLIIYKKEATTDDYGQFLLDFPLSVTANEGTYTFDVQAGSTTVSYEIEVQKYEKPTVNLEINTKSWAVKGEKIDVDFLATYLFGEPVKEAYLDISAYCGSYSSYKLEETVKMWNGKYAYTLDTSKLCYRGGNENLVISAKLTDLLSGEIRTEQKAVLVADNGLSFGIAGDKNSYVAGDLVNLKITATHPDGNPAENVNSKIIVTKYYGGQSSVIFSEDKLFSGTYNYIFNYPEVADYLTVQVSGNDGKYSASASHYVNLRPDYYWRCRGCYIENVPQQYNKDIVLEADKVDYGPSESAKITVYARDNYKNMPAILQVGTPFGTTVKAFNLDNDGRYELSLSYDEIAPVATIYAFVYNNGFIESEPVYLSASKDKEIDLNLDYPRKTYGPGDTIDLTIDTGKPYSQVTLGVVDESIMLLRNYEFTPFASMYSVEKSAGLNNVATENPRTSGSGSSYVVLGLLLLALVCLYVLSLKYVKESKIAGDYNGADRRFLFLGVGGFVVIIATFMLGIMNIIREESTGFLLFGIASIAILVSVAGRFYGAFRKSRGSRWLSAIGLAGGLMSALPLLLAVIRIYEPGDIFLIYLVLGLILLIISFVGEAVKLRDGHIIGVALIVLIIFALFGMGYLWIMNLQSSFSESATMSATDRIGSRIDYEMNRMIEPDALYHMKSAEDVSMRDKGTVPADIKIRTSFPDTALWLPSVVTDGAGKVRVPVVLPDTITSWRLEALAATKNAEIGSAKDNVISRMDYFVKASPPSEVTVGDEITVSMVIFNNHDEPVVGTACVTSSTQRCGVSSSNFRIIADEPTKTIVVPAHSSYSARWAVKFTGYGYANMSFLSYSASQPSQISDGLTKTVLVKPKEEIRTDVYSGTVGNNEVEFEIFDGAIPEFTNAALVIQPSLEAVSLDSIESLAKYPHGCAEQVMSGLYPDILVKQYLVKSGQITPQFNEKVDNMIISGLQKIYNYQHSDGGWGWYEHDQTNTFMTAYILYGLSEARNVGFFIDDAYFNGGVRYLSSVQKTDGSYEGTSHLSGKPITMTAFVTHSLLNAGIGEDSLAVSRSMSYLSGKYESGEMNDAYTIALYALCLRKTGDSDALEPVLSKLDGMKKVTGDQIYWGEDSRYRYRSLGGPATTTATALLAFIESENADYYDTIQKGISWLVSKRGGYGWGQTSDTAMALKAIAEYSKLSGESVDSILSVYLNGNLVGTFEINGNNRADVYEIPLDYKSGKNILTFTKDGSGTVYYTVNVRQVRIQEDIGEKTLSILKNYSKTKVKAGEKLPVTITVSNTGNSVYYVVVEDTIPPGFTVDESSLDSAIDGSNSIVEYEIMGNTVSFYITSLGSETFSYSLKAVNSALVFAPPAKVYAMYDMENKDESESYSLGIE